MCGRKGKTTSRRRCPLYIIPADSLTIYYAQLSLEEPLKDPRVYDLAWDLCMLELGITRDDQKNIERVLKRMTPAELNQLLTAIRAAHRAKRKSDRPTTEQEPTTDPFSLQSSRSSFKKQSSLWDNAVAKTAAAGSAVVGTLASVLGARRGLPLRWAGAFF